MTPRDRTMLLGDLVALACAAALAVAAQPPHALAAALLIAFAPVTLLSMGFYGRDLATRSPGWRAVLAAALCLAGGGLLVTWFTGAGPPGDAVAAAVCALAVALAFRALLVRAWPTDPAVVLVASTQTARVLTRPPAFGGAGARLLALVPVDPVEGRADPDALARIPGILSQTRCAEIAVSGDLVRDPAASALLQQMSMGGTPVRRLVEVAGSRFGRAPLTDPDTRRALETLSGRGLADRIGKRVLDLVGSIALLIVLAPVLAFLAATVRVTDGGPVLYRQTRLGVGGRPFAMLKFRSMRVDAEADGVARFAALADDRVTPIGRLMRRHRLDELPQLLNVLRGEMSLVGPRPERPEIVDRLGAVAPLFHMRHLVTPGLSGWAQINHPYGDTAEDIIATTEYDLYYILHGTWIFDLAVLTRTLRVAVFADGAR